MCVRECVHVQQTIIRTLRFDDADFVTACDEGNYYCIDSVEGYPRTVIMIGTSVLRLLGYERGRGMEKIR